MFEDYPVFQGLSSSFSSSLLLNRRGFTETTVAVFTSNDISPASRLGSVQRINDMKRDVLMSATKAKANGIVDIVAIENEIAGDFF
ncbi:hypothetical protein KSP39_PZI006026 [Platanthera zijinensis]|uniref:Uncharacterized protein n=1 Tax=Platanthera zijinensis TaxID=2320716 RepID=A0AAP0BUK8_9ASPA